MAPSHRAWAAALPLEQGRGWGGRRGLGGCRVGLTEMEDPVLVAGCGREWEREAGRQRGTDTWARVARFKLGLNRNRNRNQNSNETKLISKSIK
jgi:hypothetical protein